MARLGLAVVRRPPAARLCRDGGAARLFHLRARAGIPGIGALGGLYRSSRQALVGDHRGHLDFVWVAHAVAGDGGGDTRLLRPRRPRTDPIIVHFCREAVRGANWRGGGERRGDVAGIGGTGDQCSCLAGRRALACRIWCCRGLGDGRGGDFGRPDSRAVPCDRRQADAARSADHLRHCRRQLCDRGAIRRDSFHRHPFSRCALPIRGGAEPCPG